MIYYVTYQRKGCKVHVSLSASPIPTLCIVVPSFRLLILQYDFLVVQDWNALIQMTIQWCDIAYTLSNIMMDRCRLITQQNTSKSEAAFSFFVSSVGRKKKLTLYEMCFEGLHLMFQVVLLKVTWSVLVQIETEADKRLFEIDESSWVVMTCLGVDLWEMIWSAYRCDPHPPKTSRLSHGVWSQEEVNYCKELQF